MSVRQILCVSTVVMIGAVASSAPAVAEPAELVAENFRLQASNYNPVIADLDAALPRASVAAVVDSANRTGASCSPHPKAVAAFCWESGDNATTDWYPQGITTSADASPDGQYEGKTVVLTSWYYHGSGDNKGVRISFVDSTTRSSGPTAHASALPAGPEDFSYWQSRDQLWTLAEHPGHRSVLAVKASAF
jgi:hypothetical protein